MRRTLVKKLIETDNKDTYFLTAGVGFGVLEPLQKKMGDRFINVGIAEPSMISIASGLALSGKRVFTYTMCCFYLKCIEEIKMDLCYQDVPVTMIGIGTGFDYEQHGVSHFAFSDGRIMEMLYNIDVIMPETKEDLIDVVVNKVKRPRYIRVGRFDESKDFSHNLHIKQKYPSEGGNLKYYKKKYGYKK